MDLFARELNENWCDVEKVDTVQLEAEVKDWYSRVPDECGLCKPKSWQHPKRMIFNRLHSAVGVMGYIGPAFDELHVNRDNPQVAFHKHMGFSILRSGDFPIGQGFYMNDYIMQLDI